MKYPKVSVIIINYNKKEYLRDCINSVKKNTKYPNYDITVVDNCSKDGSVEMVKKEFPKVKIIEN
ncbi:MAG: glycosyltransferase, partial [Candidatus Peribacteraceae bacterium]|nr:glycosyltransferase [Candidatus Peribacteraceae bacterium]